MSVINPQLRANFKALTESLIKIITEKPVGIDAELELRIGTNKYIQANLLGVAREDSETRTLLENFQKMLFPEGDFSERVKHWQAQVLRIIKEMHSRNEPIDAITTRVVSQAISLLSGAARQ